MVYFRWYLVIPHAQTVQNMYDIKAFVPLCIAIIDPTQYLFSFSS